MRSAQFILAASPVRFDVWLHVADLAPPLVEDDVWLGWLSMR